MDKRRLLRSPLLERCNVDMLFRTTFASVALCAATAASAAGTPATPGQTSKGPALVDEKGMSLYTFDKDEAGKSACNGPCAAPVAAAARSRRRRRRRRLDGRLARRRVGAVGLQRQAAIHLYERREAGRRQWRWLQGYLASRKARAYAKRVTNATARQGEALAGRRGDRVGARSRRAAPCRDGLALVRAARSGAQTPRIDRASVAVQRQKIALIQGRSADPTLAAAQVDCRSGQATRQTLPSWRATTAA